MTGILNKFYVEHGIQGGKVMARSHQLTASCLAEDEIDTNVATIEGASGRIVRIGQFQSVAEAETAWRSALHRYPGMTRLTTLVVPIQSLRDGRTHYRIQVGTTSHAHSEVLCQRSLELNQSCTVIGLDERTGESRM